MDELGLNNLTGMKKEHGLKWGLLGIFFVVAFGVVNFISTRSAFSVLLANYSVEDIVTTILALVLCVSSIIRIFSSSRILLILTLVNAAIVCWGVYVFGKNVVYTITVAVIWGAWLFLINFFSITKKKRLKTKSYF